MSKDNDNKPRRRRLKVTEEALGENEMFRFERRLVARRLEGASEADLREFDELLRSSEQIDIPLDQILISDWKKIEAKLGELGFPPPRGWGWEREDHTWEHLSETDNTKIAAEYGTMVELHDPNTGRRIEKIANYIKRCTEEGSLPWWLAHLGDRIIRIFNEPDPDKERTLIYHYGCDRQRYLDQQGHLARVSHGLKFPAKKPASALKGRRKRSADRERIVLQQAKRLLSVRDLQGLRKKNGCINRDALAKKILFLKSVELSRRSVRQIIGRAIRDGKLA